MRVGPGFIVAAAFIGPGTITTCTLAGVTFGVTLLWVLVFATLATLLLQEMSGRLGLITGKGIAEVLADLAPPWGRALAWLTGGAVVLGVIAFEAGNLSGAGIGLAAVTGIDQTLLSLAVAALAGTLLYCGRYRLLERVLVACVAIMGIVFLITAVMVGSSWGALFSGLLLPSVPEGSTLTILALIGTTVVPYNLFLYASTVRARWQQPSELGEVRRELFVAVGIGGMISAAIVITAAAAIGHGEISSAADMARQLEPLLGPWAHAAFGVGIALAGISSAITAPLAAAYILSGLLRKTPDLTGPVARLATLGCVLVGAALVTTGVRPVQLIVLAQAANGLILPVVAAALVLLLNDRSRLGGQVNGWLGNALGAFGVAICLFLAARIWLPSA